MLIPPVCLQTIQRRLEEIEVTFKDLEEKGVDLERTLREESGDPHQTNQMLHLQTDHQISQHSLHPQHERGQPHSGLSKHSASTSLQMHFSDQPGGNTSLCSVDSGDSDLIDDWIELVEQKNALVSEESDLMVA